MNKYNYTEKDASEYAKEISQTIVWRSYDENHSSTDNRRRATKTEAKLVEKAIAAALWAIKEGRDPDTAKATAEYMIIHGSGEDHINTYLSVYIPINDFVRTHQKIA